MKYDFIIAGGGCAGLSLLDRIMKDKILSQKKILLVDKQDYTENDKTWCFWETNTPPFASIISNSWDTIHFADENGVLTGSPAPYKYHMIKSIDFYHHILQKIPAFQNIKVVKGWISELGETSDAGYVVVNGKKYSGDKVFNSFYSYEQQKATFSLQQHFKGWFIKTNQPVFEGKGMYIMDFRIPQIEGPSFMYVLPVSANQALVECTFFSETPFHESVYNNLLLEYLNNVWNLDEFEILEEELGIIPMKDTLYFEKEGSRIINLGASAGAVKPTTGYAFKNIQRKCDQIVRSLIHKETSDYGLPLSGRFRFYDKLLLYLMTIEKGKSASIFSALFRKNSLPKILKFLDERTSIIEEMGLFLTLPKRRFLKALYAVYLRPSALGVLAKPKSELR